MGPSSLKLVLMIDSDPLNKIAFEQKPHPSKFLADYITIFVSVFAVDDSDINNECTLTKYVSQCSQILSTHSVTIG